MLLALVGGKSQIRYYNRKKKICSIIPIRVLEYILSFSLKSLYKQDDNNFLSLPIQLYHCSPFKFPQFLFFPYSQIPPTTADFTKEEELQFQSICCILSFKP